MRERIVSICGQYRPLIGGTELHAAKLARVWSERGHPTEIWTRRLEEAHPPEESEGTAIVRRLGWAGRSRVVRVRRFEKALFCASLLHRLIREQDDYDIVIVHHALYPAVIASFAKRVTRKPLVIRSASTGVTSDLGAWGALTRPALGALRATADAFVVTNREGGREAVACGFTESKVRRIPNGLDPGPSPSPRTASRPVRFAFVGGLRPEKRVDFLLEAWASAGAPGELLIAGDGPLKASLEARARRLNITPTFLGNIADALSLLREVDIFVLPSDAEGMSNALLEAMAAGCACLATFVGGNVDCLAPEAIDPPVSGSVMKGSSGWLVCRGDLTALSLAIRSLAEDAEVRAHLAASARRRVLAEYDLAHTAEVYLDLFRSLAR